MRVESVPAEASYRPDIDGLRAIAVLLVVAFHAFPAYFRHGYIGVDVFFVISGYLITGILLRGQGSGFSHLPGFYGRRVRRIFPALLVVLLTTAATGYVVLLPAEFKSLARYLAASAAFVTNVVSWLSSGYFEKAAETTPLLHLWSLAIEEQFYIFWPLLLWWLNRWPDSTRLSRGLPILLGLSFFFGLFLTYRNQPLAYYHPLARAWELLAGAWLVTWTQSSQGHAARRHADWAVSLALGALVLSGIFFGNAGAFPGLWAAIPVSCAVTLLAFAPRSWLGRRFMSHPLMVYIGRISYPLYLWHWVVLAFLRIEHPNPRWFWVVAAVVLSFLLAMLTYHLIERPVQRRPLRQLVPVLALFMAALLAVSWLDYSFNFSGKRQTPLQQALEKEYDPRPAYRYRACFLDSATQGPDEFAGDCLQQGRQGDARVLLWGDSLAAQLFPGLNALKGSQPLAISQRTASSCPPSAGSDYADRGRCNDINAATRKVIGKLHPDVVILNGRWGDAPEQKVADLVAFLRSQSVRKIVLIGPTPDWAPDLRGMLARIHFPGGTLPEFLEPPVETWSVTHAQTERLRVIAQSLSISYLAPADILCQNNLCRIRVADDIPDGLIASDHDHLTALASEFLFKDVRTMAVVTP